MSVYVYAITSSESRPRLDDLHGVGEAAPPLRTLTEGPLKAVVSDAPETLRAKRRDLGAHHSVQERLLSERAVLPMRFGLIAEDDDAVRAALDENVERYTRRLSELEGRAEFNLKAAADEDILLGRVLAESEEIRRLNEATRGGAGTYEERMTLGELVARDVQALQDGVTADLVEALRPYTSAETESGATADHFLAVSFLVDRDREREFVEAGKKLAERYGPEIEVRIRGPLPPYSFS
ncbi:GvpL/GvpF family gas vesicle protein [Streptomyces sp. NPDC002018]|uniref:GvpL/GvpF family gas vesicle protein n=1 Tax=Streptomyces sp. NPDC002018 TaxID=3364629 RepID=UPI00369BD539